jgi:3-deoxy-7-phosphoheptulonate synthase
MSTNTRATASILVSPQTLKRQYPLDEELATLVGQWRQTVRNILRGTDPRLLAIVGPCSVHDPVAVVDYARKLAALSTKCPNLFFVVRTYFEKPRTCKGWSGFMHDPHLDGSNNMQAGVALSRKLMIDIAKVGLPCATETLSLLAPQYIDDVLTFACIGARTTESQPHRELASGLSVPVGFKNSTQGSVGAAIHSIMSAAEPKVFMGMTSMGQVAAIHTKGNPDCCLVLRGGARPNYRVEDVETVYQALVQAQMSDTGIVVDASHGNSGKDWEQQMVVLQYLATHRHKQVRGIMMESFVNDGKQSLNERPLTYGVSITDSCIGWKHSEQLLQNIHRHL